MPASKVNYLVIYSGESQVYGSGSKEIALQSPPPSGLSLEDKRVLFVTFQPDSDELSVHMLPQEEVMNAEIKYPTKKEKNVEET